MKWELQKCEACQGGGVIGHPCAYQGLVENCGDCQGDGTALGQCPVCKGTGYTGLIIYDPVCAALFLGEGSLVSISMDVDNTATFVVDIDDENTRFRKYIIVTISQLREVIVYREGESWCEVSDGWKMGSKSWNKNLAILADNGEEVKELINACGGAK
jgi:hypothetical protein